MCTETNPIICMHWKMRKLRSSKDSLSSWLLLGIKNANNGDRNEQESESKCSFKVSGSKIWQMERSCNCCQESGEREASVSLFCPKAKHGERKFRKVILNF